MAESLKWTGLNRGVSHSNLGRLISWSVSGLKEQLIEALVWSAGLKPEATGQFNKLREERSYQVAALNSTAVGFNFSESTLDSTWTSVSSER